MGGGDFYYRCIEDNEGETVRRPQPEEAPTYHDVVVICDGVRYVMRENYAWMLTCSRVSGWRLWNVWHEKWQLLGGEYDGKPFRIEVRGVVIVDSEKRQDNDD